MTKESSLSQRLSDLFEDVRCDPIDYGPLVAEVEAFERLRAENEGEPVAVPADPAHDPSADARDAARYRWLCDGHGFFLEEENLCGYDNEKARADAAIDEAMQTGGK